MFIQNRKLNFKFISEILFAIIFLIGGFFINNGIVSAETSDSNNAVSVTNDPLTGAGIKWTLNPSFLIDDTSSASASLGTNKVTKYLKLTGFNFLIPIEAIIDGITVDIVHRATDPNAITDSVVSLVAPDVTTVSKADTGTFWPEMFESTLYGGNDDIWERTWTPSEINDANFGVIISVENFDDTSSRTAHIDGVTVTVTYTIPSSFTLTYTSDANGTITGASSQIVDSNSDGSIVTAVANDGYHFVNWSDGLLSAERIDTNVQADISVTASFAINLSSDKDITSFDFPDLGSGVIVGTDIVVIVPFGTDVTTLTPIISFSGMSVNPLSGVVEDFTNPVTYTVTAIDNSTKDYTVTVISSSDEIGAFFDVISNDLIADGINNNLNLVTGLNYTNFSGLEFEKSINGVKIGKITFTDPLDLSGDDTKDFLKNLKNKLDIDELGTVGLNFLDTTDNVELKGQRAVIKFYGLDALGFTEISTSEEVNSNLIAYDDNGDILDTSDLVSSEGVYIGACSVGETECYVFTIPINHFSKYKIEKNSITTSTSHNANVIGSYILPQTIPLVVQPKSTDFTIASNIPIVFETIPNLVTKSTKKILETEPINNQKESSLENKEIPTIEKNNLGASVGGFSFIFNRPIFFWAILLIMVLLGGGYTIYSFIIRK